jgi:CheY-like chemotaxis protein
MSKNQLEISQANILVVDDTPDNLRLLVGILVEHGYTIRPAASGS